MHDLRHNDTVDKGTLYAKTFAKAAMGILVIAAATGLANAPSASAEGSEAANASATQIADAKTAEDAFDAMRSIASARIAIFQGDPVNAARLIVEASRALDKVKQDLGPSDADSETSRADIHFVQFDARAAVVEDFVAPPQDQGEVDMKDEDGDNAEGPALVDTEFEVSLLMMPFEPTVRHVNVANVLMAQHQYYDANLALKAAVDGVTVASEIMVQPPTKDKEGAEPEKKG